MDILGKTVFYFLLRLLILASSLWLVWDGWRRQRIGFMAVLLGLVAAGTFPLGLAAYLYWRSRRPGPEDAAGSSEED